MVEAIVEKLDIKRRFFQDVETLVGADCILASNTSSISITAIANGLQRPQQLVGMHFFNPVPQMKLVEVVSGLQTSEAVAQHIFELAKAWGKVPVHARSTPGFIVNRIARPYYAETLALLQEQSAAPATLDRCLRAAGFRMGPCELMDLIGHDTNFAVTQSVYEANFFDKRFQPSLVQRELVDGGLLGRKSGRGFFDYTDSPSAASGAASGAAPSAATEAAPTALPNADGLTVHGAGPIAEALFDRLQRHFPNCQREREADWTGLTTTAGALRLSDGRTASQLGREVAVFDLPLAWLQSPTAMPDTATDLAWAPSSGASANWQRDAPQWLQRLGFTPRLVADTPALVVARTVAMLVNEAADAVQQGVCNSEAADAAMRLGVNYPAGPFSWWTQWGNAAVCHVLDALDAHYRGERYRVSPWLRAQQWKAAH